MATNYSDPHARIQVSGYVGRAGHGDRRRVSIHALGHSSNPFLDMDSGEAANLGRDVCAAVGLVVMTEQERDHLLARAERGEKRIETARKTIEGILAAWDP